MCCTCSPSGTHRASGRPSLQWPPAVTADIRAKLIDPELHARQWVELVNDEHRATHGEIHREPQIATTDTGAKYASVLKHITGGERPLFTQGLAFGGSFPSAYGTFGSDGTVIGILTNNVLDTNAYTYTIDDDAAGSVSLNAAVQKLTAAADANRLRRDGLRWIPIVNGEFRIPVVSIHTLGDLFVPFSMEQVYQKRAAAKGNSDWLVQRAIRGASHCDFTVAEQVDAFDAMIKWERDGIKPAGDDVVTAATVAAPAYGCTFTNNTLGVLADESGTTRALRPAIIATAPCPAS
jgi:hypothetical protein